MTAPETRYARSGDVHIAYSTTGDGPLDLVFVPTWISQIEHLWEEPSVARILRRLASFSRLIMFDRRGSGMSDPIVGAPTLEDQIDDVVAVLDAVGSERAALFAQTEAGPMAILFAATHPERTHALALYAAIPRFTRAPDYPWPPTARERHTRALQTAATWGQGRLLAGVAPSAAADERLRRWFGRLERLSASPGTVLALNELSSSVDVRSVLPSISVPTLVMRRAGDTFIDPRHARYIADHVPNARYVELPGDETLFLVGDSEPLVAELEHFLTGVRRAVEPDRVLATVLFLDMVGSTERAAQLGDRRFRDLLDAAGRVVAVELEAARGRLVKTLGDGLLATFDGPARGIRGAAAIRDALVSLGVEVRAGLHTGEVELIGDDVGGLAVHIGARVGALAGAGEVLVSGTVKDLVVGSGLKFDDRGVRELRGVPGEWRLFAVL